MELKLRISRAGSAIAVMGVLLVVVGSLVGPRGWSGEWPQWLGPERDGSSREKVSREWPADGPRVVWTRPVGRGFSGPVISGGRLVLHHRMGEQDVVECWSVEGRGDSLWRRTRPATYRDDFGFDDGPRATPAIAAGRVHVLGAEGNLACLDLGSGAVIWEVSLAKEFGADKGFFGFACSPLVTDGKVMVNAGGADGAGVVAIDGDTGRTVWKATSHEAGYASPVVVAGTGAGARIAFFTREGLVMAAQDSGNVLAEYPWRSRQGASVNAATPLVVGNRIFLTSSYGVGAVLLDWDGKRLSKVWSGDDSLSSHYASVVGRGGHVYGFHGRQESGAVLRCIELGTGKVRWTAPAMGSGSVLLADDVLLVMSERGELVAASASPDGFQVLARAQVLGTGVRAYPALAGGRFVARDTKRMVCLELGVPPR
ncbi:MAG: PQQ-binding-like beta-propeller repeat protein [Limisphaerales bacterium]